MLTQERLKELLEYDPETGHFVWICRASLYCRTKIGQIAGTINSEGYRAIGIDRKYYKAHRLAFLYVTGRWPQYEVDHKNCDKDDNRWDNLREATHSQNGMNRPLAARNTSGHKGVSWAKRQKRWVAQIRRDRTLYRLGYFLSIDEAVQAYQSKAAELFGEFHYTE